MKKRILTLVLALVMVLGILPVGAGASEFNNEYSERIEREFAYRDSVSFTVPCTGTVRLDIEALDVYTNYYKYSLKGGSKTYVDNKSFCVQKGKRGTLFSGELPAGTYTLSASYILQEDLFYNTRGDGGHPGKYYVIHWSFYCSHKSFTAEEIAATCSEKGKLQYICDFCEETVATKTIDKLPHTPNGEWVTVKEPTCSETGLRTQTCTVCGETAKEEKLDRLEHSYGDWKVTKEGSCQKAGERVRTCSVCGYEDRQSTSTSDDHDFGDWDVTRKATCTETGLQTRKCRICGKEEAEPISMEKHEYGDWITEREATCGKEGVKSRKCRNCGEAERQEIPATGKHTFGEWRQENATRFHRDCAVCGYTENKYVEPTVEVEPEGSERVIVQRAGRPNPENLYLKPISFTDVPASAWYRSVVTYAYSLGLMVGNSETSFNPTGNMTLAEAVTMASRARNSYKGGTNEDFKASKVWYQTYVDYALEQGILKQGDFDNYERPATRAEMAYLFAHALPAEGMKAINTVEKLPDVKESDSYGKEIFNLYRAGVLTGQDKQGTFASESPITRAEAAAIITRITLSSERKSLELK